MPATRSSSRPVGLRLYYARKRIMKMTRYGVATDKLRRAPTRVIAFREPLTRPPRRKGASLIRFEGAWGLQAAQRRYDANEGAACPGALLIFMRPPSKPIRSRMLNRPKPAVFGSSCGSNPRPRSAIERAMHRPWYPTCDMSKSKPMSYQAASLLSRSRGPFVRRNPARRGVGGYTTALRQSLMVAAEPCRPGSGRSAAFATSRGSGDGLGSWQPTRARCLYRRASRGVVPAWCV